MGYEARLDMIVMHAWETWTKNGLHMDRDMREETSKTVRDAATNVYTDEMTDAEWLAATLKRLE